MSRTYKYSKEGLQTLLNKIVVRASVGVIVCAAVGLYLGMRGQGFKWSVLLFCILLCGAVLVFSIRSSAARLRTRFASYELIVDDSAVKRVMNDVRQLSIARDEIIAIQERSKSGLQIKTGAKKAIHVPRQLEGYEELKAQLQEWAPIQQSPNQLQGLWTLLATGGMLACLAVLILSSNPTAVVPVGILAAGFLVFSLVVTLRSREVDPKTKRAIWVVLLPLFWIVVKIVTV